jgi:hypothetical protein
MSTRLGIKPRPEFLPFRLLYFSSSHYGFGFGLGATNRIDGRLNAIENLREP